MVRLGKPTGGDTHGKGRGEGFDSTSGRIVYLLAQGLEINDI